MLFSNGCSQKVDKNKTEEVFCRVLCLDDNGMYVRTENIGHIYVKYDNLDIETYAMDTVVIEFSENDLISAKGKFIDCFGEEQDYLYILENPQNIRLTTLEEPTFGWQIPICRVLYKTFFKFLGAYFLCAFLWLCGKIFYTYAVSTILGILLFLSI